MGKHEKKEVLWRANFEEFIRCLRHNVGFFFFFFAQNNHTSPSCL